MVRPGVHRAAPHGDVREHGGQVDVLERAAAEHLRGDLARDRDHGSPVDLRVVETGEQVRRPRPGDGEAGGRPPGQLAVRRRSERGGALVADADVGELSPGLGTSHGVGEAQVGVPDHAEHVGDAPGDERLDHHVGDGPLVRGAWRQRHVDAVGTLLDVEARGGVGEALRRLTGDRVVVVAVPRATQQAVLDRPLTERPTLVRAVVVQRAVPSTSA